MVSVVTDGMFGFIYAMVESWQVAREPSQEEAVRMIVQLVHLVQLVQQGLGTISGQSVAEASKQACGSCRLTSARELTNVGSL